MARVWNGLSMSEQELTKWKNKFRLYKLLHPHGFENMHCALCPHFVLHLSNLKEPQARVVCPRPFLILLSTGEIIFSEYGDERLTREFWCLEWVKHV